MFNLNIGAAKLSIKVTSNISYEVFLSKSVLEKTIKVYDVVYLVGLCLQGVVVKVWFWVEGVVIGLGSVTLLSLTLLVLLEE